MRHRKIIKIGSFILPTEPEKLTLGQKLADKVAAVGSSWTFIICFGIFLALWMIGNSLYFLWNPFDPFPFILLNLVLSCIAAIQAPIIMMSQKRWDERDRQISEHDLEIDIQVVNKIIKFDQKLDEVLNLLNKEKPDEN